MKKIIVLLFSFLIFLFSCKKDPEPVSQAPGPCAGSIPTYPVSDSMKLYMFKTNSYWVFQNDSTAALDSVAVISTQSTFQNNPTNYKQCPSYSMGIYIMKMKSFSFSDIYSDYVMGNHISRLVPPYEYYVLGQGIFVNRRKIGSAFGSAKTVDTIPAMLINGNTFRNVIKIQVLPYSGPYSYFKDTTHLYYCDSIGTIKKVIRPGNSNTESWSLKRWNALL